MAKRIVIIGAGQNALVAAFYLARAGHKPLVLERRSAVGGAAITEEFHPGFRASILEGVHGPLVPAIVKDMQLERHGLEWLEPGCRHCSLSHDGRALLLDSEVRRSAQGIEQFSKSYASQFLRLEETLRRASPLIQRLLLMTPPEIDHPSAADIWNLLQAGRSFRKLGKKQMEHFLRWGPMAAADFVSEFFETELLRAAIASRGILGMAAGPWSAGTTATLLLRCCSGGIPDRVPFRARGGASAVSEALAAAAKQAGAVIRTNAEIAGVNVKDGAATGVILTNGEEISADAVVSCTDPKRTFLKLLDPVNLAPSFLVKVQNYRCKGVVSRLLLALDGLPSFSALKNQAEAERNDVLASRIQIGPEIDYLEHAFDDSKYGDFSRAPYLEASIPSLLDPSLAPPGKHVMTIHVQYTPYMLKQGDWSKQRDALADTVVKTLAQYSLDLPQRILAKRIITPLDFEETYGLTGGHIFHGELALDQLFTMRPLLGWARYQTPIRGLFLCGSGTHPGIGLTGASGFNAAREILKSVAG